MEDAVKGDGVSCFPFDGVVVATAGERDAEGVVATLRISVDNKGEELLLPRERVDGIPDESGVLVREVCKVVGCAPIPDKIGLSGALTLVRLNVEPSPLNSPPKVVLLRMH
jgi:hypothetical protein